MKEMDSQIFPGYQVFHNFFRPHIGLDGKTPAEACNIMIKGENKWRTLENASLDSRKGNQPKINSKNLESFWN